MNAKIFSVDIGTTSLKTAIIDEEGKVLAYSVNVLPRKTTSFLALEWVNAFWTCARACLDEFRLSQGSDAYPDAICISGNGPTVVSENGRTLLWSHSVQTDAKTDFEKGDNTSVSKKTSVCKSIPVSQSLFIPRLKAFQFLFPDDYTASRYLFACPEFLVFTLTGVAVSVLPEERFRAAYWDEASLKENRLDEEKMPPFVPLGFCAGETDFFGRKIPVFCGGPDFISALIGTATLFPGKICDRAGSSEGINLCCEKAVFEEGVRTLPSVIPGLWNLSVLIPKSGSLIREFKNEINDIEKKKNSYDEIIDYSYNDKNSEGFRLLSEISDNVKNGINLLKKIALENDLPFDDYMTSCGGQAKNERWLSEKALRTGIDIAVLDCADGELLGNAVIANVSLGNFKSIQEGAQSLVKRVYTYRHNKKRATDVKIYKMPENLSAIIFDIDSTLYTNSAYAFEQVDVQIRHFAQKSGLSDRDARNKISEWRRDWSRKNGGKKISLGNTLVHFGVTIEESIKMRENLLFPEQFLSIDNRLIQLIARLREKYSLICVTNNPVLPARKTLSALGIAELIPDIIGLDTCKKSKPNKDVFILAAQMMNVPFQNILSIGDRFDMDLAIPLEMGMGAALVSGVSGVYDLCEKLLEG